MSEAKSEHVGVAVEMFPAMPKPVRIQLTVFAQLVPPPHGLLEFFTTLESAEALRDALSVAISSVEKKLKD